MYLMGMKTLLSFAFFLFVSVLAVKAQQELGSIRISGRSIVELRKGREPIPVRKKLAGATLSAKASLPDRLEFMRLLPPARTFPQVYKYEELGVFCKLEVQMEKLAKFPVKFRLGEVQYVEKMEGKY